MKEAFISYVWRYGLWDRQKLRTTEEAPLEIIHPGQLNTDAGPDFFNAKIQIDDTVWVGNIELHVYSSDWNNHQHSGNPNYENIILHVVYEDDTEIKRDTGEAIPCLELKDRIDPRLLEKYEHLLSNRNWIPCQNEIDEVDSFSMQNWMDRLLIERLEAKAQPILDTLQQNKYDWETTFYQYLARSMGLRINADPFEWLARSLPLSIVQKHRSELTQVEALVFGQSGLLNAELQDSYAKELYQEYQFLKTKFDLSTIPAQAWKFARMRPSNFPTLRLAQFAQLLYDQDRLFSKIIALDKPQEIHWLLETTASSYWDTHYTFDQPSTKRQKILGRGAIDLMIINAVVPVLFVYGKETGKGALQDKAISIMDHVKAENNSIIAKWKSLNIPCKSASDSQALLQLKNEYCNKSRCLQCAAGHRILGK